jgi:uncharacterized protein (DUF2141 family)
MKPSVAALLLLVGCTAGPEDTGTGIVFDEEAVGETVTEAGGLLVSESGAVVLEIPPGALTDAVDITIEPVPAVAEVFEVSVGQIYEFGPEDTWFEQPVTLKFHTETMNLPEGTVVEELLPALFDEGQWVVLNDVTNDPETGLVTGTTDHFSTYGLVLGGDCQLLVGCGSKPGLTYSTAAGQKLRLTDKTITAYEGNKKATVTVLREEGATSSLSVSYATVGNWAEAGVDYTETSGTLSWADGDTTPKTIDIPLVDDKISSVDKDFFVYLSAPSNGSSLGSPAMTQINIHDDDGAKGAAGFVTASSIAKPTDTDVSISVERLGSLTDELTMDIDLRGVDYDWWAAINNTSLKVTWAKGVGGTKTFKIPIAKTENLSGTLQDTKFGTGHVLTVAFGLPYGVSSGPHSSHDVHVLEHDGGQLSTAVSFGVAMESDAAAELVVERLYSSKGAASVDWEAKAAASGSSATAGADFTAAKGTLSWADGVRGPQTLSVPLLDDSASEGVEWFDVVFTNASGVSISRQSVPVSLRDDEPQAAGTVGWKQDVFEIRERDGKADYQIPLTRTGSTGAVRCAFVTYSTQYTIVHPKVTSVSWKDGESGDKFFPVTATPDNNVNATSASIPVYCDNGVRVDRRTVNIVIEDDDPGTFGFAAPTQTVTENKASDIAFMAEEGLSGGGTLWWFHGKLDTSKDYAEAARDDLTFTESYTPPDNANPNLPTKEMWWLERPSSSQQERTGPYWASIATILDDDATTSNRLTVQLVEDLNANGKYDVGEKLLSNPTGAYTVHEDTDKDGKGDKQLGNFTSSQTLFSLVATDHIVKFTGIDGYAVTGDAKRTISVTGAVSEDFFLVKSQDSVVYVFEDRDGDNKLDTDETHFEVKSLEVKKDDGTGTFPTTMVGTANSFKWEGALTPGTYKAEITLKSADIPNVLATHTTTEFTISTTSATTTDYEFGYQYQGAVKGLVYLDINANGVNDNELGALTSVEMFLDADGDGEPTSGGGGVELPEYQMNTANDGTFKFKNVPPADYKIRFPNGYVSRVPRPTAVTVAAKTVDSGVFGLQSPGILVVSAFEDTNGNGIKDAGEPSQTIEGSIGDDPDGDGKAITTNSVVADIAATYKVRPGAFYINPGPTKANGTSLTTGCTTHTLPLTGTVKPDETLTLAFGFGEAGALSGTVYDDTNVDGDFDSGEPGLDTVTVTLKQDSDKNGSYETSVGSTQPNSDGSYAFVNLSAGTYQVSVATPSNYTAQGNTSVEKTLARHAKKVVDFGFVGKSELTGVVYADDNFDGVLNSSESGISSVEVNLRKDADEDGTYETLVGSQTVGNDGAFLLAIDPGVKYQLDETAAPTGRYATTPNAPVQFTGPSASSVAHNLGFGLYRTFSGTVFLDHNNDGALDSGDDELDTVDVTLMQDVNKDGTYATTVGTDSTDTSGEFAFDVIRDAAAYRANIDSSTLPAGLTYSGTSLPFEFTGKTTELNFPYVYSGQLSGIAFADANGNGVQDLGEGGLATDLLIHLDASPASVATVTPKSDGTYTVKRLQPGSYDVRVDETQLPNTTVTAGANPSTTFVVADTGTATAPTLGYAPVTTVSGTIFKDADNDGNWTAADSAHASVDVTLTQGSTQTATTDASGNYSFSSVVGGAYTLDVDGSTIEVGMIATTGNLPASITVGTLAYVAPAVGIGHSGRLTAVVFHDDNQNGAQDVGEPPYAGADIDLTWDSDSDGTPDQSYGTGKTNGVGQFSFVAMPPGRMDAVLRTATLPSAVGASSPTTVQLTLTQSGSGTAEFAVVTKASLAGTVFGDADQNGVLDTGEKGLIGVSLSLHHDTTGDGSVDAVLGTEITGNGGAYTFSELMPGVKHQLIVDTGTVSVGGSITTANQPFDYTPSVAQAHSENIGYGADEGITGTVFLDRNGDGVNTPTVDAGFNATVNLKDSEGEVVSTTTPLADGSFQFAAQEPGEYSIDFEAEDIADFVVTVGDLPSEVSLETGSAVVPAIGLAELFDIDGTVFDDLDESGLEGVNVELKNDDDTQQVATDEDGAYAFADVPAGDWTLTVLDAEGVLTTANSPSALSLDSDRTVDFGYSSTATVDATVFDDVDLNAYLGNDEEGLEGITVTIRVDTDGDNVPDEDAATSQTDADGLAHFYGIKAGWADVVIDEDDTDLEGLLPTGALSTRILLVAAESHHTQAGFVQAGTLSGTVFVDLDGNGGNDDEPPLEGVTVEFLRIVGATQVLERTATSGEAGTWASGDVLPGEYNVRIDWTDLPAGGPWQLTAGTDPSAVSVDSSSDTPVSAFGFQEDSEGVDPPEGLTFSATDLGFPTGSDNLFAMATGLGDLNEVTVNAYNGSGELIAGIYVDGEWDMLPGLSSADEGLNTYRGGIALGYAHSGSDKHCVTFDGDTQTDLGTGLSDYACEFTASNGAQFVGVSQNASQQGTAFQYDEFGDPEFLALGGLGGTASEATSVNSSMNMVGWAENGDAQHRAVFWPFDSTDAADLPLLAGVESHAAYIGDTDVIVGWALTAGGDQHAVRWDSPVSSAIDLGTLGGTSSNATAANAIDIIVGVAAGDSEESLAFIYDQGTMYDLNALVTSGMTAGCTLTGATAISNTTSIAANAECAGDVRRAFLLTLEE